MILDNPYIYIYVFLCIKFHEALVPLVPVFSNPVMFLLLFEQSVNMHVCTSRAKKQLNSRELSGTKWN